MIFPYFIFFPEIDAWWVDIYLFVCHHGDRVKCLSLFPWLMTQFILMLVSGLEIISANTNSNNPKYKLFNDECVHI